MRDPPKFLEEIFSHGVSPGSSSGFEIKGEQYTAMGVYHAIGFKLFRISHSKKRIFGESVHDLTKNSRKV